MWEVPPVVDAAVKATGKHAASDSAGKQASRPAPISIPESVATGGHDVMDTGDGHVTPTDLNSPSLACLAPSGVSTHTNSPSMKESPSTSLQEEHATPKDNLMTMMAERDEAGRIQNVYYNKSSAAWFFRITFNNKHVTFSVAGLGKLEHAVIRECLMAVLQDATKTNTDVKVLGMIKHDIALLQEHGPECPPEKLRFSNVMPLYHTFMSRADAWLAKLSKERGQGQAAAVAARALLSPVSQSFSSMPVGAFDTAATDADASMHGRAKSMILEALQAALDGASLHGVHADPDGKGAVVMALLPNRAEVALAAPEASVLEAMLLRELFLLDTRVSMPSLLTTSLQSTLAADWQRWKHAQGRRGEQAVSAVDTPFMVCCENCVSLFVIYAELRSGWLAKAVAAGMEVHTVGPEPAEMRAKVTPKEEADPRGNDSAARLLAMFSQLPLHLIEKYQPRAGSASALGKSRLWQELRDRESDGGLRGVNAHQSSATSFSISIPGFNTTLSRVDKLENAVVSEILIQLTSSVPRNISVECAAKICQDLEAIGAVLTDDINFENIQGLNFMDALPMYRLVLSRLVKWTEQIERRRTSGASTGAGPGRKRRRVESNAEPADDRTTYNTRPVRHLDREDSGPLDSGVADTDDDADLPSRPESRAAIRRADSRQATLRNKPPPSHGGNGRRWNADSSELPAFGQVSHVFLDPVTHAKDFEALITVLRQCVGAACTSCGERRVWTGVYNRFRSKWVRSMQTKDEMPESIAIYSDIQDFQRQGQYYAIMDAIDSYLGE